MNYRDHYYPNQTSHDARDMEVHISMHSTPRTDVIREADYLSRSLHRAIATNAHVPA